METEVANYDTAVAGIIIYAVIGLIVYAFYKIKNFFPIKQLQEYLDTGEFVATAIIALLVVCYWPFFLGVAILIWVLAPVWFRFKAWRDSR